jgi:type III secretion protein L
MYLFKIKDAEKIHAGKKIIPRDEFSQLVEAKDLILEAKEKAEEIIAQAHKDAEKIHEEAKESGYNEGLEPFNTHILFFQDQIKRLRMELQKTLLPLVQKTTKRIIGSGLKKHPELVIDVITQAIKDVTSNHEIKLFVNEADLELVEGEKENLKNLFENLELFIIEKRADVEKGSCIIQTEKGILNANLSNQYTALKKALKID